MDAAAIIADLHGKLLRMLADTTGNHFMGLSQAARCKQLHLSSKLRRWLVNIDIAFNMTRHISSVKSLEFQETLQQALTTAEHDGRSVGEEEHMEVEDNVTNALTVDQNSVEERDAHTLFPTSLTDADDEHKDDEPEGPSVEESSTSVTVGEVPGVPGNDAGIVANSTRWPEFDHEQQKSFQEWFMKHVGERQELVEKEVSYAESAMSRLNAGQSKVHLDRARQLEEKLKETATKEFVRQEAWRYHSSVLAIPPCQEAASFQLAPVSKRGMPGPSAKPPRPHGNAKKKYKSGSSQSVCKPLLRGSDGRHKPR